MTPLQSACPPLDRWAKSLRFDSSAGAAGAVAAAWQILTNNRLLPGISLSGPYDLDVSHLSQPPVGFCHHGDGIPKWTIRFGCIPLAAETGMFYDVSTSGRKYRSYGYVCAEMLDNCLKGDRCGLINLNVIVRSAFVKLRIQQLR